MLSPIIQRSPEREDVADGATLVHATERRLLRVLRAGAQHAPEARPFQQPADQPRHRVVLDIVLAYCPAKHRAERDPSLLGLAQKAFIGFLV